jgi:hypothetical protein
MYKKSRIWLKTTPIDGIMSQPLRRELSSLSFVTRKRGGYAIVGLYLDPPAHSLVLSLDQKNPRLETFDCINLFI